MSLFDQERGGALADIFRRVALLAIGAACARSVRRLRPGARWRSLSKQAEEEADQIVSNFGEALDRPVLVVGGFDDDNTIKDAVRAVIREWPGEYEIYTPNLNESLFELMNLPTSPTRYWILGGAILGQCAGWGIVIYLSMFWPHPVAGMPIIAVPPFVIISFEMMVLLGVGAGCFGLLFHCGLPGLEPAPEYLDRFKQDQTGIVLICLGRPQVLWAKRLLEQHGAEEIRYAY